MTKPKFFASSITVLIGIFINLENIVFSSYLLVKIDDSSVDSKAETTESFGPITKDLISRSGASRAITKDSIMDVAVKSALIEIGDALIHGNNGTVRILPMSKVFKPPFKAPKKSNDSTTKDDDEIEDEKIENELEKEINGEIPSLNETMGVNNAPKGRSFSQRSSGDGVSARDKKFCEEKTPNSIWPECRVKCYRSNRGRPQRCYEFPAVKYCGCSPGAARKKTYFRLGRMKYVDGRLQNEPVDNAMCADLNRRGWGCRSCTDGYSWDNTYVKGKMFPSSSQHPDGKCLEQPEKRCDGFDPKNHWFHPKTGEGVGFRLNKRTCQEQRHQGEIESYCKVDCDVDGFCTETVKQRKCECPSSRNEESRLEEKCITAAFRNGKKLKTYGDDWGRKTFDACDSADFRCKDCKRKTYYDDGSYSYDVTRPQWEEPEYCEDNSSDGSYEDYGEFRRMGNDGSKNPQTMVVKRKQTKVVKGKQTEYK